jgi:GNAT superfamily N-acetyltransferase
LLTSSSGQSSLDDSDLTIGTASALGVSNANLAAFYSAHWVRAICLGHEDFLVWQMCEAPESQGKNTSVVALMGTQLVAAMGVTPANFQLDGAPLNAAALTTWIVLPEARGMGIGQRMLAFLQENYDVLAGAGISAAALPLYLGAGFSFLAHVPRFFCITDFRQIRNFVDTSDAALKLTDRRQKARTWRDWQATPCRAGELRQQASAGLETLAHFRRDVADLTWRYDRHPTFEYEAFAVNSSNNAGHGMGVILREDRIGGCPILHLVDLFGDAHDADAALSFVEDEALRRSAAFVDFSGTSGALTALFRARGWSSAVDDPLVELPSLFHPVELRHPPTTSVVLWSHDRRESLFDFGRLHLTKSDLDLDRPVLNHKNETQP